MSPEEYIAANPQNAVFIQVDDTERLMTDEEYKTWVAECVHKINNPLI